MPKLVIINQQYPPEVVATGQIFRVMAEHMQSRGFQVTVVTGTPYYPGLNGEKIPRREIMGGVTVRRLRNTTLPKKSLLGKFMNLFTFEVSLFFYCLFSIPRDATVLVATAPPMAVLCAAAGRFFRRYRVVAVIQDLYPDALAAGGISREDTLSYRALRRLMRVSMAACAQVVTISTDMRSHLMEAYGLKGVTLIPNLFPETIRVVDRMETKARRGWAEKLVVQYSGNFGVAHEYETLLAAVRALQDEPGILFQVAGAGKNYDALAEICKGERLSGIVFEDYAPLDALECHLGTADISMVILSAAFRDVLLPSKYYGILASGRGVLLVSSCESDISRDIEAEGLGLRFNSGEGEKLAEALLALAREPERLADMGARARALYERKYSQEIVLGAYEALIRQCFDNKSKEKA